MKVKFGKGKTEFGPGVKIKLSGNDVALAIHSYLVSQNVFVSGPCTVRVNGEPCQDGSVYVDPSGSVMADGIIWSGRGCKDND